MYDKVIISKELAGRIDISQPSSVKDMGVIPLSIWCGESVIYTAVESANINSDSLSLSFHLKSELASLLLVTKKIAMIEIGNLGCKYENCDIESLRIDAMGEGYLCSLVVETCNTYNT